jgi:hypothetical protein
MEIWVVKFTYTNENATLYRRMKQRLMILLMGISLSISNSEAPLSYKSSSECMTF